MKKLFKTLLVILNEAQRSEESPCTNTGVCTGRFPASRQARLATLGMTIIIYLLSAACSFAQQTKIDSLKKVLQTTKEDTTRIKTLNALSSEICNNQPDKAIEYANMALELSKELDFAKGKAASYNNIARVFWIQGDYPKALKNLLEQLKIYKKLNSKKGIVATLGNIGNIYSDQGDYTKALEYFFKALKIDEELGNENGIAHHLGNIGTVYKEQGDMATSDTLCQVNYSKALEYYFNSLKVSEELGNKIRIANNYVRIGIIYDEQDDHSKALEHYFDALEIYEELGNKTGIAIDLGNIGELYIEQKHYTKAKRYLLRSLEIAKEIGYLVIIKEANQNLSELYIQTGLYKKAYEHHKEYSIAKDSLFNEEKSKEIGKLEARAEYDKQLAMQQAEQEKKEAIADERSNKQRIIIWSVSVGLLLLVVFAFFIVHRLRITRKQKNIIQKQKQIVDDKNRIVEEKNKEITQKNKDITDSIRYAQNIQQAILPKETEIKKALPEHFVYLAPRDFVSGDFFWFTQKNGKAFIAACDCTGHGVPGAFVSMIGNDLLNQIIIEKGIDDPGEILSRLSRQVKSVFTREDEQQVQDGMDMTLCVFDKELKTVGFAGANNPLFLIRDGKLIQTNGDKTAIGGTTSEDYEFTNHTIKLWKDDCLYIFSDGYQDQFGGPKGKKFMKKRLKELLLSIQSKSMEDQKKVLNKTIKDWQENREQVDDILVIGVRI